MLVSFFRSDTVYIVIMALNIHITVVYGDFTCFLQWQFSDFFLSQKLPYLMERKIRPVITNTRHWYAYCDHNTSDGYLGANSYPFC